MLLAHSVSLVLAAATAGGGLALRAVVPCDPHLRPLRRRVRDRQRPAEGPRHASAAVRDGANLDPAGVRHGVGRPRVNLQGDLPPVLGEAGGAPPAADPGAGGRLDFGDDNYDATRKPLAGLQSAITFGIILYIESGPVAQLVRAGDS